MSDDTIHCFFGLFSRPLVHGASVVREILSPLVRLSLF